MIRVRYRSLGGHVHMAVFVGTDRAGSFGKAGDLVMRVDEFSDFQAMLSAVGRAEFIDENAASTTCPQCGFTSYNRNDIDQRYCVRCHQFYDEMKGGTRDVPGNGS